MGLTAARAPLATGGGGGGGDKVGRDTRRGGGDAGPLEVACTIATARSAVLNVGSDDAVAVTATGRSGTSSTTSLPPPCIGMLTSRARKPAAAM